MITKEVLKLEFRYSKKLQGGEKQFKSKTITIGIFETIEEAVEKGNTLLNSLSKVFVVRATDRFKVIGLSGLPDRLVSNCCYPTKGVQYFAKIEQLNFEPVTNTIQDIFKNKS